MRVISIAGTNGGVGCTTVAAQLAFCLAAQKHRVIAFDFSPQNALRLHFGMPWDDDTGLVPQTHSGKPWNEAAYCSESGINFIPFGKTSPQIKAEFTAKLEREPGWLSARLQELDEPDGTYVIIDCPQSDSALSAQAYAASDLVIVVMEPDTLSYAAFAATCAPPAATGKLAVYLINGFDPTHPLDREISRVLRATPNNRLCPVVIHRDELVREALANKLSLNDYAPYSQTAGDFVSLTTWIIATFAHLRQAAS